MKKPQLIAIIAFLIIIAGDFIFLFKDKSLFYFILGIGFVIGVMPFILLTIISSSKEQENNEMFLEFSRDLVESVKSGTPISRSIINLRSKNYGTLTPYIQKLANQIALGIPVSKALEIFSRDVKSSVVERSVLLIREAERAGGAIEDILQSVASSVSEIEKLKTERKAAIYSLVVEGYIIFFVFILIMLVMQFKILPMTVDISSTGITDMSGIVSNTETQINNPESLTRPMLLILITQGFFAGLMIGKLSEGNVKSGLKHSFILVASSLLIYLGANVLFR